MTQVYSLDIDDLIRELNLGRATVKFMLNRFSVMLPHDRIDGRTCYNQDALSTLIRIKELMDQGLMPSQIESALTEASAPRENQVEDVRMSQDALAFIQNLFQDIKRHQSRIAQAHEKRAEAEERKAVAIEKRAEAEEKKAQAMNNIATALQEMGRHRPVDAQTMEIAGHAAQALTMTETDETHELDNASHEDTIDLDAGLDDTDLNDLFSPPGSGARLGGETDLDGLEPDDFALDDLGLDDLALEIAEPEQSEPATDDLSSLVDEVSTPSDETEGLDDLLEDPGPLPDLDALDDLEQLVDSDQESGAEDLDDLSSLVDRPPDDAEDLDDLSLLVASGPEPAAPEALDDLSALVDTDSLPEEETADLDNLSLLVDAPASDANYPESLDDLSLLVDARPEGGAKDMDDLYALVADASANTADGDLDDLSLLVDTAGSPPAPADMDDLSALVTSEDPTDGTQDLQAAEPSLKPDITPEEDMAKYKAAVMKIIIDLKNKGLSAGETTDRLNRDQVPTLSGKPQWREKAIAKIYGFIESAH